MAENVGRKCRVIVDDAVFGGYNNFGRNFCVTTKAGQVRWFDGLHARVEWVEDVRESDRVIDADGKWWVKTKDEGGTRYWRSPVGITYYDEAVKRPFRKQFREDGTEVSQ